MTPDDLLGAYREDEGPDADARARLMGRLAALGEPGGSTAPKRVAMGPWLFGAAALAAAVALAWFMVPRQAQQARDTTQSMASDAATHPPVSGEAQTHIPAQSRPAPAPLPPIEALAPADPPAPATALAPPVRRETGVRRPTSPEAVEAPPPDRAPADTLAAEAAHLGRVRAFLSRRDAAGALASLKTYDATYTAPRLAEEAQALRTMARCTRDGADPSASVAFGRRHPGSMFRAQVERACGKGSTPTPEEKSAEG